MSQDDGLKRQDVLGHGFDVRYVDALDWGKSSKGKLLFKGGLFNFSFSTHSDNLQVCTPTVM